MRLNPQLNHELAMAKNATSATALRGVVGHAANPRMTRPTGGEVASTCPVIMMSAICSVNGINSHKPRPQASITCGRRDGVNAMPATITIRVARSAKTKASGTHRSVQPVNASAIRARIPASAGGFVFFAERGSGGCIDESALERDVERCAGLGADVVDRDARMQLGEDEPATLFYFKHTQVGDDEVKHP